MAKRKLTFVKAGEHDASEVTISTGTHTATEAETVQRETYTVSYPSKRPVMGAQDLKDKFAAAAQAIIDDAAARGEPIE